MKTEIKSAAEKLWREHNPAMSLPAWLAYVDNIILDVADINDGSLEDALESYYGHFNSTAEFGEHVAETCGYIDDLSKSQHGEPNILARYIDFHAFGKDLILGGDYWVNNGHYFLSA